MNILKELRRIKKLHYDSTKPMNSYFRGMYNGLELAISIISKKEPKYKADPIKQIVPKQLLNSMDCTVWAEAFMTTIDSGVKIDESLMISWFANAIMCGHDIAFRKQKEFYERPNSQRFIEDLFPRD